MNPNFHNGNARSNTGMRQIAFHNDLSLKPVIFAINSGYAPDRGTVQASPVTGDLIARVEWTRKSTDFSLLQVTESGPEVLNPATCGQLWEILESKHKWLESWLQPVPRGSSFIPVEAYGETVAEKTKRKTCNAIIKKYGLPLEYNFEWQVTPRKYISNQPVPLDFNPNAYVASYNTHIGSLVGIRRREVFYSSNGDKSPAVELKPAYRECHGSNYAHDKQIYHDGIPGLPGWNDRKYLIRVILGAFTREHHSYGVEVTIWDTELRTIP